MIILSKSKKNLVLLDLYGKPAFRVVNSVVTRMALKVDKNAKKEQLKARDFELYFSIVNKS